MTYLQLEHAIRAACNVSGDTELFIFGSQAIHGSFPDPSPLLTTSIEVDLQPKNLPEQTAAIDGALGEGSDFHREYGFYVHGVEIAAAFLPKGWEGRCAPVFSANTNNNTGWCVEAHDLAASKLVAFRDKDKAFVVGLLSEGLVNSAILCQRIEWLDIQEFVRERTLRWVRITMEDIASD